MADKTIQRRLAAILAADVVGDSPGLFNALYIRGTRVSPRCNSWAKHASRSDRRISRGIFSANLCRTAHRMMCAIEDAGFEICDTLMWVYGSAYARVGAPRTHQPPAGAE